MSLDPRGWFSGALPTGQSGGMTGLPVWISRATHVLPRTALGRALRASVAACAKPQVTFAACGMAGHMRTAAGGLQQADLKSALAFHFFSGALGTLGWQGAPAGQYAVATEFASGPQRYKAHWPTTSKRSWSAAASSDASSSSATTTSTSTSDDEAAGALRSRCGAASIPHPDKRDKGGEDSHFVSDTGNWLGVADGVGGWAELGIDAGAYARKLMEHSKTAALKAENLKDPLAVLQAAFSQTAEQGSCTACLLTLTESYIRAANVGDSGFVVVRKGKVLFRSPPQQHEFNFPYQLGQEGSDTPRDAQCFMVPVQSGDVVVVGTDGLFDNVFDRDVAMIASRALTAGLGPEQCAKQLASLATALAQDQDSVSPFAKAAREAGYAYRGGKADDVTVVVSFIE
mmetsp:Transcript_32375/g.62229  ORF Transcript_32375/g.62229 Transcript_32375/m.62229 type:complete len:401 (-) Transcript_32375:339-1541(-)